jgi:serine/threonine-protein kinase
MHGSSVVLIALLTSALTATGTTYLVQRYEVFPTLRVERTVSAPALVGLSEGDARENAEALHIALLVEGREAAAGAAPGTVLRQSVAPGSPISEGGGVGVVFAAALPHVPAVTELALDEAKRILTVEGYKPVEGAALPDANVAAGVVVAQLPVQGTELAPGGVVTLRVSSGAAELAAPKVAGLPLRAASDAVSELGLAIKVRWISKAETVTGVVLSQKPAPGEKMAPKSTVEVVVNR